MLRMWPGLFKLEALIWPGADQLTCHVFGATRW